MAHLHLPQTKRQTPFSTARWGEGVDEAHERGVCRAGSQSLLPSASPVGRREAALRVPCYLRYLGSRVRRPRPRPVTVSSLPE